MCSLCVVFVWNLGQKNKRVQLKRRCGLDYFKIFLNEISDLVKADRTTDLRLLPLFHSNYYEFPPFVKDLENFLDQSISSKCDLKVVLGI